MNGPMEICRSAPLVPWGFGPVKIVLKRDKNGGTSNVRSSNSGVSFGLPDPALDQPQQNQNAAQRDGAVEAGYGRTSNGVKKARRRKCSAVSRSRGHDRIKSGMGPYGTLTRATCSADYARPVEFARRDAGRKSYRRTGKRS